MFILSKIVNKIEFIIINGKETVKLTNILLLNIFIDFTGEDFKIQRFLFSKDILQEVVHDIATIIEMINGTIKKTILDILESANSKTSFIELSAVISKIVTLIVSKNNPNAVFET